MTYKIGTQLLFKKHKVTFINYSTRRANTREVLRVVKIK